MSSSIKPAWVAIVLVTLVANGVLYAIYSKERGRTVTTDPPPAQGTAVPETKLLQPPPSQPGMPETHVEFRSEPYGAQVFEGDDAIGETPMIRVYPRPSKPEEHRYRFELDGHLAMDVSRPISGERVVVQVNMIPEPPQKSGAKPRKKRRRTASAPPPPPPPPPAVVESAPVPRLNEPEPVPRVGEDEEVPKVGRSRDDVPKLGDDDSIPRVGDDDEVPKL